MNKVLPLLVPNMLLNAHCSPVRCILSFLNTRIVCLSAKRRDSHKDCCDKNANCDCSKTSLYFPVKMVSNEVLNTSRPH